MTCIPSIVDDILEEIEAEFRARRLRPAGHDAASNAATLRVAHHQRGPEERTMERFAKESGA